MASAEPEPVPDSDPDPTRSANVAVVAPFVTFVPFNVVCQADTPAICN